MVFARKSLFVVTAILLSTSSITFADESESNASAKRILNSGIEILGLSSSNQLELARGYEIQFQKPLKWEDFKVLRAVQISSVYLTGDTGSKGPVAQIKKALSKYNLRLGMVKEEIDYFKVHGDSKGFFAQSRIEYLPLEKDDLVRLNAAKVITIAQFFSRTVQDFLIDPTDSFSPDFNAKKQVFGEIFEFYKKTLDDDVIQRSYRKHNQLFPEVSLNRVRMSSSLRGILEKSNLITVGPIAKLSDEEAVTLVSHHHMESKVEVEFYELREHLIQLTASACQGALTN